jgi:fructokinase
MHYHVYGLGNALVDMEYEIDDAFLAQHEIAKGHMTLVEAERLLQLSGDLADHAPRRCSGGSAANSLMAVSALGGRAFYSCKVADDEVGHFFVQDMRAAGVDTNAHEQRGEGITGQCLVLVTADAERSMNTFLGISGSLGQADVDTEALEAADMLYLEGYLCTSPSARDAVTHARELAEQKGIRTVASLSDPSVVQFFGDDMRAMLGTHVDHLFCNEEEALAWTGASTLPEAVAALKDFAHSFAVTRGAEGSLIWDGTTEHAIATAPIKPVDSNGAGDIYAGAYLYGLGQGWTHEASARLASRAAARLVARFGARLPVEDYPGLLSAE